MVRIVPFHRPQEHRAGFAPRQTQLAYVGGWNVSYGSQRECPAHRHRAIDKAQKRLRGLSKYTLADAGEFSGSADRARSVYRG